LKEALGLRAKGLRDIATTHGKKALAGFGTRPTKGNERGGVSLPETASRTACGFESSFRTQRSISLHRAWPASSVAALDGRHQLRCATFFFFFFFSNRCADVMKAGSDFFLIGANPDGCVNHPAGGRPGDLDEKGTTENAARRRA